jgi:hypothetical protein
MKPYVQRMPVEDEEVLPKPDEGGAGGGRSFAMDSAITTILNEGYYCLL